MSEISGGIHAEAENELPNALAVARIFLSSVFLTPIYSSVLCTVKHWSLLLVKSWDFYSLLTRLCYSFKKNNSLDWVWKFCWFCMAIVHGSKVVGKSVPLAPTFSLTIVVTAPNCIGSRGGGSYIVKVTRGMLSVSVYFLRLLVSPRVYFLTISVGQGYALW